MHPVPEAMARALLHIVLESMPPERRAIPKSKAVLPVVLAIPGGSLVSCPRNIVLGVGVLEGGQGAGRQVFEQRAVRPEGEPGRRGVGQTARSKSDRGRDEYGCNSHPSCSVNSQRQRPPLARHCRRVRHPLRVRHR